MALAGLNPMRWLNSSDPFERAAMQAVAQRRADIASEERQDLAERIINALSKAMKK